MRSRYICQQIFLKKTTLSILVKLFLFTLSGLLFSFDANSQTRNISGIISDANNQKLPGASVSLLQLADSSVVTGAFTDTDGRFSISNISSGKYFLKISFIGFEDLYKSADLASSDLNTGILILNEAAKSLKEVNIEAKLPPVQVIGDTTQFNADAYKVNKDATTEDLVAKMPGITIQDGKVQAQGEDVKKVLIDGKPYLGDDPNAALKNLPAEVVEKIQVFDKKSDQSEFTGFDDGNASKTINIVTRPQFRNGTFGRVYGGYGSEERWKSGLSINNFKDKRKFTIIGTSNNINEQNFSTDDLLGVIGTSSGNRQSGQRGSSGQRGGGSSGRWQPQNETANFLVDQRNGLSNTNSAGLNYSNQWKKTDFTFSYFLNNSDNNSTTTLFRQYYSSESDALIYEEDNLNKSENINHRANVKFEYKFDTLNSILIQPRISVQNNKGSSSLNGNNSENAGILSNAISSYNSDFDAISFSSPILYRHSFHKKGRTFSANFNPVYNQNEGTSDLNSLTVYINDTTTDNDTLNQISDLSSWNRNFSTDLVYTEPLDTNNQLSFSYNGKLNTGFSDKKTFSYSSADELYNSLDTSLSNKFESKYQSHSAGVNYRYQNVIWNMMIGAAYQVAGLTNEQTFPVETSVNKKFYNILPSAMFQYKFTSKKNMRLYYRSSNNSPTVSQLQDVINNNNPLLLSSGNPDLKQDWQNFLNIRYSGANPDKSTSFFALISGTYTDNYIGNSTFIASNDSTIINGIILLNGSQLTKPVNLDGYYSIRSFGNYSFPVGILKSSLNLNASGSITRSPGLINDELNYSTTISSGIGFALSSNISPKFDFLISSNGNSNNITNTIKENSNSNYYSLLSKIRIQVLPWKGLVLQTDVLHQRNSGLSSSYNNDDITWNASIGYKFLKDRLAELRLSVFDILEQNNSIVRNTTDAYYEDVQSNVLEQYFMLTFTYNLKFFKVDRKKEE